ATLALNAPVILNSFHPGSNSINCLLVLRKYCVPLLVMLAPSNTIVWLLPTPSVTLNDVPFVVFSNCKELLEPTTSSIVIFNSCSNGCIGTLPALYILNDVPVCVYLCDSSSYSNPIPYDQPSPYRNPFLSMSAVVFMDSANPVKPIKSISKYPNMLRCGI